MSTDPEQKIEPKPWWQLGWVVSVSFVAVVILSLIAGGLISDQALENYDLDIDVIDLRTPTAAAAVLSSSTPKAAQLEASDNIVIFNQDSGGTFYVEIPNQSSSQPSDTAAATKQDSPEAAGGSEGNALIDHPWLMALMLVLLFGTAALLGRRIFSYLQTRNAASDALQARAITAGLPQELVSVPSFITAQAPPDLSGRQPETLKPTSIPQMKLDGPAIIPWTGTKQVREYSYSFDDKQEHEVSWSVEPESESSPDVSNVENKSLVRIEINGPGGFILIATLVDGHGARWLFPLVVVEQAEQGPIGPAPIKIPYVGAGWGTATLCLFLILVTTVLSLAGSIESAVVSGVFLAVAGYLFGKEVGSGAADKKDDG